MNKFIILENAINIGIRNLKKNVHLCSIAHVEMLKIGFAFVCIFLYEL